MWLEILFIRLEQSLCAMIPIDAIVVVHDESRIIHRVERKTFVSNVEGIQRKVASHPPL